MSQREIGSSFIAMPVTNNIANYVLNNNSRINGGIVSCITDYFKSIGGTEEKVITNSGFTLPVHVISENMPIGPVVVKNYDNRLELELPQGLNSVKANEFLSGFENVLKVYPTNAETLVADLKKRMTKIIERSARERDRYPELCGDFDVRYPPKYLVPVPIRVGAKKIYYAIKDALVK